MESFEAYRQELREASWSHGRALLRQGLYIVPREVRRCRIKFDLTRDGLMNALWGLLVCRVFARKASFLTKHAIHTAIDEQQKLAIELRAGLKNARYKLLEGCAQIVYILNAKRLGDEYMAAPLRLGPDRGALLWDFHNRFRTSQIPLPPEVSKYPATSTPVD